MTRLLLVVLLSATAQAQQAPADRVPTPQPERCIPFLGEVAEGEMAAPEGLDYLQVKTALNGVIQAALYCPRPEGFAEVHLTYELKVGCDGIVSEIEATDDGGAPKPYVDCVASVIKKADFDAHDMENGMPVTYPVDVAW